MLDWVLLSIQGVEDMATKKDSQLMLKKLKKHVTKLQKKETTRTQLRAAVQKVRKKHS